MNKNAFIISRVVGIILILVTGFVALSFTGLINNKILDLTKDEECLVSAYANSYSKIAGADAVEYKCPTEIINVKLKNLDKDLDKDFKEVLVERGFVNEIKELQPGNEALRQYNLDALMAEQLESCWRKTGEGKLDLFSEWQVKKDKTITNYGGAFSSIGVNSLKGLYNLGKAGVQGISSTFTGNNEVKFKAHSSAFEGKQNFKELWDGISTTVNPESATFCVVCSIVKFDDPEIYEESQLQFRDPKSNLDKYLSLDKYLMYHEHKNSGISKYEYLFDYPEEGLNVQYNHYNYNVNKDNPQGIIFLRTNLMKLSQIAGKTINVMGSIIGVNNQNIAEAAYDRVIIADYENINKYCDILVNPGLEENNE